jgi:PAS domain S-box-containing protein
MKKNPPDTTGDRNQDISILTQRLQETHQELQELTGGEVDAVIHPDGHAYLLDKAQEKLQRSATAQSHLAAMMVTILNSIPANVALLDSRGVIISVNENWRRFATANILQGSEYGVDQNYLEICERVTSEGAEEAHAAARGIRRVLKGEVKDFSMEYPCHSPNEKRWFQLMVTPVREGGMTGAVVMHLNITERKLAEEQATEQLELIKMASSVGRLGAWAIEYPGPRIIWSEEVYCLHEVDPEFKPDMKSALTFFPGDSRRKLEVAIQGRQPFDLELDFITAKGRKLWVRTMTATEMKNGKLYRSYGIFQDLTARKQAEARFRRLVDSNAQSVFFWNTEGEIMDANDAFLNLVGYTREELNAGRISWSAITPPEHAESDRRALEEVAANGVCTTYEKEYIRKDGSRVPILIGAATFEDTPTEGVCFVLDLTERKKLEQQFLRAQRMESIGTLAGGIAHDLNNILAPILMSIDILKLTATDPQATTVLETIGVSARRGADIVRQVLSFARGMEGERIEVQPKHLVKDIESIIRDTFPKNIQQELSLADDPWTILGDPTQLHQVLLNLCVNARDAMPNGGKLTISIENCVLDQQSVAINTTAKPGRYVLIGVADSGTGIPLEILDKIFEPFFTTKEVGKGTGLGLSTVMGIVKSHEGVVNVYSEPGKGTIFRVYLPAMENSSEVQRGQTQSISLPRGNGEMVLIVEDETAVLTITSETLQAFGYRVLTATDGAEAVAVYARHQNEFAVVLTDMMMPVMDGPATIRALLRINPAVKIIATSGLDAHGIAVKVSDASVKHFLMKPYTTGTLLKALRMILDEA